jgi:hypothetical protein
LFQECIDNGRRIAQIKEQTYRHLAVSKNNQ